MARPPEPQEAAGGAEDAADAPEAVGQAEVEQALSEHAEPAEVVDAEVVEEEETEPAAAASAEIEVAAPSETEVEAEVAKALALREHVSEPTRSIPSVAEVHALSAIANRTHDTTFVPVAYRGREADVFAAFMFGRELGLGPMMSLRDIHMIDGKPALAAHRQLALLRRGGVVLLESEGTADRAWMRAKRLDTGEIMTVEFTMEEAKKIADKGGKHLVDKQTWKSYPADMLWARCVGRLTRRLGPDIAGGLPGYTAEEQADLADWEIAGESGGDLEFRAPDQRKQQQPQADQTPEYRKERIDYNWPTGLGEIKARLADALGGGEDGEANADQWLAQARAGMFPDKAAESFGIAERTFLFQKLSGVLLDLESEAGDLWSHPTLRALVAEVMARRLGGIVVEGPPWAVSPTEEDRPTRGQWVAEEESGRAPEDATTADTTTTTTTAEVDEAEDIPFGDDRPY